MESFKVSNDPHLADKLEAIVGLYLNPPEHALVLSVDEKSMIDQTVTADKEIYLICDNYSTNKHERVQPS